MQNTKDPLSEYQQLRKRIINNDELSDEEWELFFELEEKNRELKRRKEQWESLLLDAVLMPEKESDMADYLRFLSKREGFFQRIIDKMRMWTFSPRISYVLTFLAFIVVAGLFTYSIYSGNENLVVPVETNKNDVSGTIAHISDEKVSLKEEDDDFAESSLTISLDPMAFIENPVLEGYVSDNVRSVTMVKMDLPLAAENISYNESNKDIILNFKGTVYNKSLKEELFIKIFTNKEDDYVNDLPILVETLKSKQDGTDQSFSNKLKIKNTPGLYYYAIEDMNSELLYLNKFIIK